MSHRPAASPSPHPTGIPGAPFARPEVSAEDRSRVHDVVILGGGLAGLSLARQLLLETERTVLLLERRPELPTDRQKVGESLVQLGGWYFSKVLDLEEHLLCEHFMKYNLRFYWPARSAERFEDFSHSAIRPFSNIASYQMDRNKVEAELLRRNLENPRFTLVTGVDRLDVDLVETGEDGEGATEGLPEPHRVSFALRRGELPVGVEGVDGPQAGDGPETHTVRGRWVIDTTGRVRHLARKRTMTRPSTIRHGAFFWWVDGLVNIEKLTERSPAEIRKAPEKRHTGHLPYWLATNHFCGEGYWFWVIPLQGKTSLGLVFDNRLIDPSDVFSVEKATRWVSRELPLLADDLARREVLDFGGYKDFAHDCAQTISPDRWALAGEAGRFSDPLYSPGSDLIAVYNTLIVSALEADPIWTTADDAEDAEDATALDTAELTGRCRLAEQIMRAVYSAYVPGYAVSYDTLGDQETFSLKYTWELATYFAAYVFPFVNDLLTERRFALGFLRQFSRLGPVNRSLQELLSAYYQWKKAAGRVATRDAGHREPVHFDFMSLATLRQAETTFYEMDLSVTEAKRLIAEQVDNIEELARLIAAHIASQVLDDPGVVTDRAFVEALDPQDLRFDPEGWRVRRAATRAAADGTAEEPYPWTIHGDVLDPTVLDVFRPSAEAGKGTVDGAIDDSGAATETVPLEPRLQEAS